MTLHAVPEPPINYDTPTDHPAPRTPPHDHLAEQSVLGACLLAPYAVADVLDTGITASDFYRPGHELIWHAITQLTERGHAVDAVTAAAYLRNTGDLAKAGGHPYLHELVAAVPSPASATHYARIIRDRAIQRKLIAAGTRITELGWSAEGGDPNDLVDAAQRTVTEVADGHDPDQSVNIGEDIDATLEALQHGHTPGIPTGLTELDRILNGGLPPGSVTTIAARTAVGKTVVGLQIALNVAATGAGVGYTSLEMHSQDLLYRAYANLARVDYGRLIRAPKEPLTEREWAAVSRAAEALRDSAFVIPRRTHATVAMIRSDIRRALRRPTGCALWVVDYLQLITPAAADRSKANREQQVAAMMRTLKLTALELGVPLIVLAQLNRDMEKANREPVLSDIRESGAVEQDSDNVILLHRDLQGDKPDLMGIKVAKNRRGPITGFPMTFEGSYQRLTPQPWSPSGAVA